MHETGFFTTIPNWKMFIANSLQPIIFIYHLSVQRKMKN